MKRRLFIFRDPACATRGSVYTQIGIMVLFVPEWNGPTEKAQDTAQRKGTCYI